MTPKDVLPNATGVTASIRSIPPDRFRDKLIRTAIGIVIGMVAARYGAHFPGWLRNTAWLTAGIMVAGEWVLFPARLLLALAKDAAPAIAALKKALKNGGS